MTTPTSLLNTIRPLTRRLAGFLLTVSLGAGIAAPSACGQSPEKPSAADDLQSARALSRAFQRVAHQIEPAVVHIVAIRHVDEIVQDGWFGRRTGRQIDQPVGFGSGFIVEKSGLILTNNHVVEPAESIKVKLADGREFDATIVGRDPLTDLAVIRIKDVPGSEALPTAQLGDSDALDVGDWVIAIGSPFGFTNTVTTGIVSAKSRSGVNLPGASREMYQDFIQTDAAINPGNSGGPLLDLEGKVIGINSAIATRAGGSEGIGFAIPVHIARAVMDSIVKSGKVIRGYAGIEFEEATAARLRQLGVQQEGGILVTGLAENSPAAKAGLKPDDIIIKYNGRPMTRSSTLRAAIAVTPPGTRTSFDIVRSGKSQTLSVDIGDQNSAEAQSLGGAYSERFGAVIQPLDAKLRQQLGKGFARVQGVMIRKIDPLGLAGSAGFEEGDIVVAVDGQRTATADDFKAALEHADLKNGARVDVIRNRMRGNIELREE